MQDLRGPLLRGLRRGSAEEHADVRRPGHLHVFRAAIAARSKKVRTIPTHGLRFERSAYDQRMSRQRRRVLEKQHLRPGAVSRLHRRRRNGDHSGHRNTGCNAKSDGATHRMTRKDGAIGSNHAAREQLPQKRFSAAFRALGRKWTRRAPVAWKIWSVDPEILLGKASRQVRHDFLVRGNSMKQYDRSLRSFCGFFRDRRFHPAAAGIDEVRLLAIRSWHGKPQSQPAQQNSRKCSYRLS